MKNVAFDLETNALKIHEVTRMHCLVLRDLDSNTMLSCTDSEPGHPSLAEGLSLLSEADRIYGHNIIYYDMPVLAKLYPKWKAKGLVRDTYLIAAMRFAHQKDLDFPAFRRGLLPGALIGLHTIEAWGYRLGVKKVGTDIEDWSTWTPLMQRRCESDTKIVKLLVQKIREAKGLPMEAVETEHELAVYLRQQEANGWPFDIDAAISLQGKLAKMRDSVEAELKKIFLPWDVSRGMFTPKRDDKKRGYKAGVPVERFKIVEFNPGSRDHIADRLEKLFGWNPTVLTNSGRPVVSELTLSGLPYPPVPKLLEYLLLEKRLGQIAEGKEAWLNHATKDMPEGGKLTGMFHIHHRVKQNGAVTHRAAHASPNLGQVPTVDNPFGAECRGLFLVPRSGPVSDADWVELGVDASGLELRCLAHYMGRYDDGAYGEVVLAPKGSDKEIHLYNANILGIPRPEGKTFIYAYLYGAGDEKLGSIIEPKSSPERQAKVGAKARAHFQKAIPALGYLVEAVREAIKSGYLKLIDGRRAYIRSEHAALNTLLQGTGAIICKRWIVHAQRRLLVELGPNGWRHEWAAMGWIHDEVQTGVRVRSKEKAADIWIDTIRGLRDHYNFRLPLDGDFKFGRNWAECH